MLRVTTDPDRGYETVAIPEPVTTHAGLRLRLAAGGGGEAGERFQVDIFDPAAVVARRVDLTLLEAGSVSFADSADTDSISGAWIAVREDTVQAWRVDLSLGAVSLESWVDEDGRLVDGDIPGGYRVERTAFELAFFSRPGATPPGSPPAGRADTVRTGESE